MRTKMVMQKVTNVHPSVPDGKRYINLKKNTVCIGKIFKSYQKEIRISIKIKIKIKAQIKTWRVKFKGRKREKEKTRKGRKRKKKG
jgi:hypothetical protein